MSQQLSLSCPSSNPDAINLLLLQSQSGQDSGSTWHCQWCFADVSMAAKLGHGWMGNTQGVGPPEQPRTFGAHGRGAVVRHGREDTGVIADVGIGLPADVAIVRVESGGAGDEIGTN